MNIAYPNAKAANPNEENNILVIFDFLSYSRHNCKKCGQNETNLMYYNMKKSACKIYFTIRGVDKISIEPIIELEILNTFL